jgi:hypothetical protein
MEIVLVDPVKIVICPAPAWTAKSLPRKLVHEQNIETLFGVREFLRIPSLTACVSELLEKYGEVADLLAIANGCIPEGEQHDIQARISFKSGVAQPTAYGIFKRSAADVMSLPIGPQLLLRVEVNDEPFKFIQTSMMPLLFNARCVADQHVVYAHTFGSNEGSVVPLGIGAPGGKSYIGITKRGWAKRYQEHHRSADVGSPYHFHRAIREWSGKTSETHQIISCGLSQDDAMSLEEGLVERLSLYPRGLNMIPGGMAGIRYLAQHGFAVGPKAWENRHVLLRQFATHCERSGRPNPLASALWYDPSYVEKVICGGDDRLKPKQIRDARFLASLGRSVEQVASEIGARNVTQVRRLLSGATYSRVA